MEGVYFWDMENAQRILDIGYECVNEKMRGADKGKICAIGTKNIAEGFISHQKNKENE